MSGPADDPGASQRLPTFWTMPRIAPDRTAHAAAPHLRLVKSIWADFMQPDIQFPNPVDSTSSTRTKSCPGSPAPLALVDVDQSAAGYGTAAALRRLAERHPYSQITLNSAN